MPSDFTPTHTLPGGEKCRVLSSNDDGVIIAMHHGKVQWCEAGDLTRIPAPVPVTPLVIVRRKVAHYLRFSLGGFSKWAYVDGETGFSRNAESTETRFETDWLQVDEKWVKVLDADELWKHNIVVCPSSWWDSNSKYHTVTSVRIAMIEASEWLVREGKLT